MGGYHGLIYFWLGPVGGYIIHRPGYRSISAHPLDRVSGLGSDETPVLQVSSYWGPMNRPREQAGYRSFCYIWLGGTSVP